MLTLREGLDAVQQLRALSNPSTERQRLWADRLANTEKLLAEALDLEGRAGASPEDTDLRKKLAMRRWQAQEAVKQVMRGVESHQRNYEAAHGATAEERRAGWNQAYADRILREEGRVVRRNKKRSDMTPEEWSAHKRVKERVAKAKQRDKKRKESKL